MKEAVLAILTHIEDSKIANKQAPTHVVFSELQTTIREVLNELYHDGSIEVGKTIHGNWIKVVR